MSVVLRWIFKRWDRLIRLESGFMRLLLKFAPVSILCFWFRSWM